MSSEDVKQKIIMTAIECIESEGLQGVTIRKIADQAGVNVAAINYHFGSKEQLFKIVMNSTLNESFVNNIQDYEDLWLCDTKKALQLFLEDTLQGAGPSTLEGPGHRSGPRRRFRRQADAQI